MTSGNPRLWWSLGFLRSMKVWKSNGRGRAGRSGGWRVQQGGRAVAAWPGKVPGKHEQLRY